MSASTPVGLSPTRLDIARSGDSADVTLENQGDVPVTYAVRGYAWAQTPQGEVDLQPTSDLIVYPQRVTIAPHERRPIRVGYTGPLKAAEGEYRVLLTEIGDVDAPAAAGVSLTIRNRFSIPLFVAPQAAHVAVDASDAYARDGIFGFALIDTGTVHALSRSVEVHALDANGGTVFAGPLPPWYLLPGQPRAYETKIDKGICARIARIRVDATYDSERGTHVTLEPKKSC